MPGRYSSFRAHIGADLLPEGLLSNSIILRISFKPYMWSRMPDWFKKTAYFFTVSTGLLIVYIIASFYLRERRVEQVEVGMTLSQVSELLGEGRPIDAFHTELLNCPPHRNATLFNGNANIFLNGAWEDYIKVGEVEGIVCDVTRFGL